MWLQLQIRIPCFIFMDKDAFELVHYGLPPSLLHTKYYLLKIFLICYRYLEPMPYFSAVTEWKGQATQ